MSEELLKYDNIGSYEQIKFLFERVLPIDEPIKTKDLQVHCLNTSLEFSRAIDGLLILLTSLLYLERVDNDCFAITEKGRILKNQIWNIRESTLLIVSSLFEFIQSKYNENPFLNPFAIKYDEIEDATCLQNNLIPLKYSGLKKFLLSLGYFKPHPYSLNLLLVGSEYNEFVQHSLRDNIKQSYTQTTKTISLSLEQFKIIQNLKELHGKNAEEFVLRYELQRLSHHNNKDKIKVISDIDMAAGYDIISFNTMESIKHDRFIEVKSFVKNMNFYWTSNEINCAKRKRHDYFVYLVDRDKMIDNKYEPTIIQNPYITIFQSNNWLKREELWHVSNKTFVL